MSAHVASNHPPTVGHIPAPRAAASAPSVSVRVQMSGPWTIVVVDGEMDIQVLSLLPELAGEASQVAFDLHGVTFMDACALGAIINSQRRVVQAGGHVRLVAHSTAVLKILMLTGTSGLFRTFDTLEQALHTPLPPGPQDAS